MLDADELLARAARASSPRLRFLDLSPVVIVGGQDAAAFEQALEADGTRAVAGAARGHGDCDLLRDLIAVGTIGTDGPAGPAPRPADGIQTFADAAALVDEL